MAAALDGGGPIFAVGGVFLSVGAILVDEKVFKSAEQANLRRPRSCMMRVAISVGTNTIGKPSKRSLMQQLRLARHVCAVRRYDREMTG
jgi:hypothetical protein